MARSVLRKIDATKDRFGIKKITEKTKVHKTPHVNTRSVQHKVEKISMKGETGVFERATIYDPLRYPHIAETLCREYGMDLAQIAPILGVTVQTISSWMRLHPDFKEGMRRGRDDFDGTKVENALLKRALGYGYKEKSTRTTRVKARHKYDDYDIMIPAEEITVVEKEMAADVRAITFWLTNRQRERWQMVTTVNANINAKTEHVKKTLNVTADLSKMDVTQLKALREMVALQDNGKSVEDAGEVDMIEYIEAAAELVNKDSSSE